MLSKIKRFLTDPDFRFLIETNRFGMHKKMRDDIYLKKRYKAVKGVELNLDNPRTLDEKLQWLKLYNRRPEYTDMVDKAEAKKCAAKIIGEEHIIPTIGVYNSFDEIDFEKLPNAFVMKCTHDSKGVVICDNKKDLDINEARKKIEDCLKRNFYYIGREWPYKNVKPRIIIEEYMSDCEGASDLTDYKFYCFNGKADCVLVCAERSTGKTKFYFFDRDWQLRRYNKMGKEAPEGFTMKKPDNLEEMFALADALSESTKAPYVRVDLYSVSGKTYFGEYTFFPGCGLDKNRDPAIDLLFGNMTILDMNNKME